MNKSLSTAIVVVLVAIGTIIMANMPIWLGTGVGSIEMLGWYFTLMAAWIVVLIVQNERKP